MTKRITIILALILVGATTVHAYNGRTTVSKQSEAEHKIHFAITFQEHDGMLRVTVVAPQKVTTLPLSKFAVVQIEKDNTMLRVPMVASQWEALPNAKGQLKLNTKDMGSKVTFAVSQATLPPTKLEVVYGSGGAGWTYVVDLATYQQKKKDSTTKSLSATE